MTSLSDFEIFARVARTGNMSAAGRELKLSPAVISKRISTLESTLGARLFQRTTRQLTLTDVGEGFFRRIVDIINLTEEAYDFVGRSCAAPKGLLTISCSEMLYRSFLLKRLPAFSERFTEIEFEIDLSEGDVDVIGGGYDAAIVIGSPRTSNYVAHRIAPVDFHVYASKDYLARHGAPRLPADLAGHNCISAGQAMEWALFSGDRQVTAPVSGRYRSRSYEFARSALLDGLGLAFMPAIDLRSELQSGLIERVLPAHHGDPELAVLAIHPSKEYVPAKLSAFVDDLVAGCGLTARAA